MWERLLRRSLPKKVALYTPLPSEVDVASLACWLIDRGVAVVHPQTAESRQPLTFAGQDLGKATSHSASSLSPDDWILVPGLVFDNQGARLGFGEGYYDRTLALTQARRIGVFFEAQRQAKLPSLTHDVPMDGLLTENSFVWVARAPSLAKPT